MKTIPSSIKTFFLTIFFTITSTALFSQDEPKIVIDVICGRTCIHASKVYKITASEVRRLKNKMNLMPGTILLRKWMLMETEPPTTNNTILNYELMDGKGSIPLTVTGYGSPTVLMNEINIAGVPWSEDGYASCAMIIPDRKMIRKHLMELLRSV